MEEKERYELHEIEKNYIEIFDNVRHIWITEDNICERLNDYEKKSPERIKALEEEIKKLQDRNAWYNIYQIKKLCYDKTRAKFDKLCEENKQLKEENVSLQKESIRDNKNWIEEIRQLKQSQKQLAISELEALVKHCYKEAHYSEEEDFTEAVIEEYVKERIEILKGKENANQTKID